MLGAILLAVALIAGLPASATPRDQVSLNIRSCHDLPRDLVPHLDPTQLSLRRFLQLCPVHDHDGDLALFVLIFRVDWASDAHLFDQGSLWYLAPTPDPQLLDRRYRVLGKLPEAFPTKMPGDTRVIFSDWHAGFPHRIKTRVFDDAASLGTHDSPTLTWDARRHLFTEVPAQPVAGRER